MVLPAGINLTLVPRLTSFARTVDLRTLDLSPTDGFVLSRIDGLASGEVIVRATGLDDEDVRESLASLVHHRLVEMPAIPNMSVRSAGSIMPHDLHTRTPGPKVSVVPPSLDSSVKASISGSYAQVSVDRPSARPRAAGSNAPPPPSQSFGQQLPPASPLHPSTFSGPSGRSPSAPPARYNTPTTVAQVHVPPSPIPPPPRSSPMISGATRSPPSRPPPSGPVQVQQPGYVSPGAAASMAAAAPPAAEPYESLDGIDLEPDFRTRIEDLFSSMDTLDYYTLLRVDRSGDKKLIKRAYYELASHFHPDKYFRKNLGAYKAKMEAIFGRFTIAHDTLTSKADRAEYDAYLGIRESVREQETRLSSAQEEIRRAEEEVQRAAQQNVAISVNPPADLRSASIPASPTSTVRPHLPSSPSRTFDAQAAREALARKLLGGAGAGRPSSMGMASVGARVSTVPGAPSAPPGSSGASSGGAAPGTMNPRDAVDALKRRYEERIVDSRSAQVQKYKANAEALLAKGDWAAALNSLRVALSFDPDNAELYALTTSTQKQADEVLSVNYEKQARYEEKAENWREAARSWAKVARARPNEATAHERAANALLRSGGNMREASELAKRAVAIEPQNAGHRATLAAVYIGGGMMLNAKREIDAALQLAPTNPAVLHVARRLKEVG
jgi:tetratricopeptide (TPR) repeat protein